MTTIRLNRRELNRIQELLTIFNESADYVELIQETVGGIGTILEAKFQITHKDVEGEFTVTITDHKDW